jgi:hypothetical protein
VQYDDFLALLKKINAKEHTHLRQAVADVQTSLDTLETVME